MPKRKNIKPYRLNKNNYKYSSNTNPTEDFTVVPDHALCSLYQVKHGDTLSNIAQNHNYTLKKLLNLSGNWWLKKNPNIILSGDLIHLNNHNNLLDNGPTAEQLANKKNIVFDYETDCIYNDLCGDYSTIKIGNKCNFTTKQLEGCVLERYGLHPNEYIKNPWRGIDANNKHHTDLTNAPKNVVLTSAVSFISIIPVIFVGIVICVAWGIKYYYDHLKKDAIEPINNEAMVVETYNITTKLNNEENSLGTVALLGRDVYEVDA